MTNFGNGKLSPTKERLIVETTLNSKSCLKHAHISYQSRPSMSPLRPSQSEPRLADLDERQSGLHLSST